MWVYVWQVVTLRKSVKIAVYCVGVHWLACIACFLLEEKIICIEILERRIQEEDSAEVNEMVRTAKVTPEQLAALLRQSATTTPNPAALSAVGATFEK